ncbi:MAG: alpha-amylase family glycosyl hydrolase [Tangfeifania sp.]
MKYFSFLFIAALFLYNLATAQITTNPELPVASQSVTITFDSSEDSRLGYYTGDLYAHTGVIIQGNTEWQHVIGDWGVNAEQPQLTHLGNGIYELEITPDINSFYSVEETEKVLQLAFVFRTADANNQTADLFVNVYEEGLVVEITQPAENQILPQNQPVTVSATASLESELKLFLNETLLADNTGTAVSADYTFTETGSCLLIAEANAGDETVRDSVSVYVRAETIAETKPAAFRKGINYPSDTSAALVLWAPYKEFVFVLGDFNNWQPTEGYQMKKDGDYFWLEIPNLEKGKEYAFQYFIDGEIKIADPYTEKILDPWNDEFIGPEIYPDLKSYPDGKTEGIVSVLQPGEEEYEWQVTDFQPPAKEKMVIYELLIRDFTEEHTYKAVREKLDYLEDLNINVLELMPVNEFEGNSSWGYNPSFYFAPDKYYGPKNELKKLIDECHKRGIAVVLDMVLNHSYGQSPFVQMYMDNWTITAENPWYNVESNFENQALTWGYDFNHESEATEELVDSVNSFWMNEYKIDGFRFDFTKGFSNTPYGASSWGSEYDADRILNLQRMSTEIWDRNDDAIIIFEHLAHNNEEKELADFGILMWGNMHGRYLQAACGNVAGSDLSGAVYTERNWNQPNLVSYPESHDEERIMYQIKIDGLSSDDYNTRNQQTALDRIELNALFHLPLPGPKMIWQFGERGYDISIDDFGGRLSEKPPRWYYLNNSNRVDLFRVMAKLNYLKQTYPEFTSSEFAYDLTGDVKWYTYFDQYNVFAIGNFDIEEAEVNISFPDTGKWYEFFSQDSVVVTEPEHNFVLAPGEYRLYSTRKFAQPDIATENLTLEKARETISFYPNPATDRIVIEGLNSHSDITIYSITGKLVYRSRAFRGNSKQVRLENFKPGIYILNVIQEGKRVSKKLVVK